MSIFSPKKDLDYLQRWAAYASTTVAIMLIIIKCMAYVITESVSLLSSLLDSTVDALASLITVIGVMHAQRPADHDHRFGHGKAEPLAALAQAAFIGSSALFLVYTAVSRLIHPQAITRSNLGIAVMVISIMLTFILVIFQRYVIRQTNSLAIGADHLHYNGDLLMNTAVIITLILSQLTSWLYIDPLFGFCIALYLFYGAFKIARSSLDILMDKELSPGDRNRISEIVLLHPNVRNIHDIRTRSAGAKIFIEFHLELDAHLTLAAAHDITHQVEDSLHKVFPTAEILIHQEPAGLMDERLDERLTVS